MGGIILLKKPFASAIILLFILTSVTPMVIGYKAEIKEKDELLANLAFVCFDRYGGSSKLEYYEEYLLQREDSEDVESEEEIRFVKTPQTSVSLGPMVSAWPMFGHDNRRTGRSPYGNSGNIGVMRWRTWIGDTYSSPAIDHDGTIYIGSLSTSPPDFYAINPDGTEKWSFDASWIFSSPTISENGTIYFGSIDGKLYALNSNGTLKWKFNCKDWVFSSPVIKKDGTIIIGVVGPGTDKGRIHCLNPNGTEKWYYDTGDWIYSSPAVDDDGNIYIGSHDGYLYALYSNGSLIWKFNTRDEVKSVPTIGKDGTIYVGSWNGKLYAINPNGSLQWEFQTGESIDSSPTIASDGTIYIGSYNGLIFSISSNGTENWRFQTDNWILSSAVIDKYGVIYFGSMDGYLYVFNSDGSLKWKFKGGGGIASPAIGEDGTIYIGSGNYLKAIEVIENNPPSKPTISGPLSGKINEEHNYSFVSTDADGDEISYYIEWGDGTSTGWTRLKPSGEPLNASHTWNQKDVYTVRAKAKDNFDAESDWATLEVSMPKSKPINLWFYWFFEQHPLLERLFYHYQNI